MGCRPRDADCRSRDMGCGSQNAGCSRDMQVVVTICGLLLLNVGWVKKSR